MTALNSTVAEIRSTTFGQRLSEGRPALTTGADRKTPAWGHFNTENDQFTKAGSGRTSEKLRRKGVSFLSAGLNEAWYLDHGVSDPRFIQEDWEPYYMHDPFAGLSESQLAFNLGGEVSAKG